MDYFTLLNTEPAFDLDLAVLKQRYYELSRMHHPDTHTGGSLLESAEVNTAYSVLRDRDKRLGYLVKEFGSHASNEGALPQDFLFEMMELNEEIENASEANSEEGLSRATGQLEELKERTYRRIAELFKTLELRDAATAAATEVQKLKYFGRLEEKLKA